MFFFSSPKKTSQRGIYENPFDLLFIVNINKDCPLWVRSMLLHLNVDEIGAKIIVGEVIFSFVFSFITRSVWISGPTQNSRYEYWLGHSSSFCKWSLIKASKFNDQTKEAFSGCYLMSLRI